MPLELVRRKLQIDFSVCTWISYYFAKKLLHGYVSKLCCSVRYSGLLISGVLWGGGLGFKPPKIPKF
jgi:hypothetical protein